MTSNEFFALVHRGIIQRLQVNILSGTVSRLLSSPMQCRTYVEEKARNDSEISYVSGGNKNKTWWLEKEFAMASATRPSSEDPRLAFSLASISPLSSPLRYTLSTAHFRGERVHSQGVRGASLPAEAEPSDVGASQPLLTL